MPYSGIASRGSYRLEKQISYIGKEITGTIDPALERETRKDMSLVSNAMVAFKLKYNGIHNGIIFIEQDYTK